MDNAQKAIMIGVGLFITIIIIAAVMLITGMGQDLLTSGQQEVSNISASLQAQLTSDFDGTTISGAQVIAAVKRYYKDESMVIKVYADKSRDNGGTEKNYGKLTCVGSGTENGAFVTNTGTSKNNNIEPIGSLTNASSSTTYVPNSAKYKANLIKIAGSDDVIGIVFSRI